MSLYGVVRAALIHGDGWDPDVTLPCDQLRLSSAHAHIAQLTLAH